MLATVERVGNMLPDPAVLFIALLFIVWVLSWILSGVAFAEIDPRSGDPISVTNLLTGQGMGYQDNIRVLYAYSFDARAITGFKVLDSKETPGLGDRVEIEPHFIANFEALDVRLDDSGDALAGSYASFQRRPA